MGVNRKLPGTAGGTVLVYAVRQHEPEHDKAVHFELGKRIARLLKAQFEGEYDKTKTYAGRLYFLPSDTLIGMTEARRLGIETETDLFGGVAPYAFIPTKAITHPLRAEQAYAPQGWSRDFGLRVKDAVLRGYTSFTLEDAREAGIELLQHGVLRLKPVHATAGRGQVLVSNIGELDQALQQLNTERLSDCGVVLEEHLDKVKTYSVGQVRVANMVASYVGTQRLTKDNHGELVYGGSDLIVTRGGFDALHKMDLPDDFRGAIAKAQTYDQAATDCFTDLFASRRNYDIAGGVDTQGKWRVGVLEQSWRSGGASSAEIAALEVFQAHEDVQQIRASTIEIFGQEVDPPASATEVFRGEDKDLGLIRKYVTVEPYGN